VLKLEPKTMATLTIRNLDDDVRDQLRIRAARHGRSMEDEVRVVLRSAVTVGSPSQVWQASRALFSGENGVDLGQIDRTSDRTTPDFQ
jgi:antitoxin FitA